MAYLKPNFLNYRINIYDYRNRLVEKKIPGKGWEYIIYDKLDRPILTQDPLQRAKATKEWLYTKYDKLGRVILTGLYKDNGTRITVQTLANSSSQVSESYTSSGGAGVLFSYTNIAFPTNIPYYDVYSINYYDQYVYWTGDTTNPATTVYGGLFNIECKRIGYDCQSQNTGSCRYLGNNHYRI